ncbi:Hypothetical_protein [Hexamita inflata]|uniref:Hypothetical_protein n=1 Tax=Hexamita inflata TaxID=28002 RepID=A0AA86PGQ2_9EUKA|nr:Hypothetical protein HINF_LOCUS22929 [Hexamita inflata]
MDSIPRPYMPQLLFQPQLPQPFIPGNTMHQQNANQNDLQQQLINLQYQFEQFKSASNAEINQLRTIQQQKDSIITQLQSELSTYLQQSKENTLLINNLNNQLEIKSKQINQNAFQKTIDEKNSIILNLQLQLENANKRINSEQTSGAEINQIHAESDQEPQKYLQIDIQETLSGFVVEQEIENDKLIENEVLIENKSEIDENPIELNQTIDPLNEQTDQETKQITQSDIQFVKQLNIHQIEQQFEEPKHQINQQFDIQFDIHQMNYQMNQNDSIPKQNELQTQLNQINEQIKGKLFEKQFQNPEKINETKTEINFLKMRKLELEEILNEQKERKENKFKQIFNSLNEEQEITHEAENIKLKEEDLNETLFEQKTMKMLKNNERIIKALQQMKQIQGRGIFAELLRELKDNV